MIGTRNLIHFKALHRIVLVCVIMVMIIPRIIHTASKLIDLFDQDRDENTILN